MKSIPEKLLMNEHDVLVFSLLRKVEINHGHEIVTKHTSSIISKINFKEYLVEHPKLQIFQIM